MALDPTPRQMEVLRFIVKFQGEHWYPPTVREIGGAMGVVGTNGVMDWLNALERKGLLYLVPMQARAMRPTDAGWDALEADRQRRKGMPKRTGRPRMKVIRSDGLSGRQECGCFYGDGWTRMCYRHREEARG